MHKSHTPWQHTHTRTRTHTHTHTHIHARTQPLVSTSEDRQEWNHVKGTASGKSTGLSLLFFVAALSATALSLVAEYTNDFDRDDEFHPSRVALTSRHFSMYNRQFNPSGPKMWGTHKDLDTHRMWIAEEARRSLCIVAATKKPTTWWPVPEIFNTNRQLSHTTQDTAIDAFQADLMALTANDSEALECRFHVPYTAVWGAMAVSFLGFAAVAFYSKTVMAHPRGTEEMSNIADTIHEAAMAFLHQEYQYLGGFVFCLFTFLLIAIDGVNNDWVPAASVSFLFGAALSAGCGYFGMSIATEGNCRTAAACYSSQEKGVEKGLQVAFRTGACMGIGVVSCGIFGLTLCYAIFGNVESLGGFGFGSSAVALFARVGGGIYTKAADVGADLCGKVDKDLGEDSPKNPATIADCVGDNVGDVAGMGADLFESFVGSIVAAAVLGAPEFGKKGVALPFYIVMIGLFVSIVCTWTISVTPSKGDVPSLDDLLGAMRNNVLLAGFLITVCCLFLCGFLFETEQDHLDDMDELTAVDRLVPSYPATHGYVVYGQMGLHDVPYSQKNPGWRLFGCIVLGLAVGILIGMVTEYFTSHTDEPTQSIGRATEFGPGPVIIQVRSRFAFVYVLAAHTRLSASTHSGLTHTHTHTHTHNTGSRPGTVLVHGAASADRGCHPRIVLPGRLLRHGDRVRGHALDARRDDVDGRLRPRVRQRRRYRGDVVAAPLGA